MKEPAHIRVSPTSLPHKRRGHGVILSLNEQGGFWPDAFFLDRDQATALRDEIDRALEQGADRAA